MRMNVTLGKRDVVGARLRLKNPDNQSGREIFSMATQLDGRKTRQYKRSTLARIKRESTLKSNPSTTNDETSDFTRVGREASQKSDPSPTTDAPLPPYIEGASFAPLSQFDAYGVVWALAGAIFYACYMVFLRWRVKGTEQLDIPMFFG